MRLISWNVNGGGVHRDAQLAALRHEAPDILALQEILWPGAIRYAEALRAAGWSHVATTLNETTEALLKDPLQRRFVALASRWPVALISPQIEVPWPSRVLSASIETPSGPIEVHVLHAPNGTRKGMPYQSDWRKIETFEAVFAALARPSRHPRILCGDFNTPIHESQDGKIYTGIWRWQGRELTLRPGREGVGGRWDRAELSILRGLSEFDLSDVFRKLYGPERVEFSFYTRKPHAPANASDPKFGRRFDHVLASTSLSSPSFEYLHRYRTGGLSDHSPCAVLFDLE